MASDQPTAEHSTSEQRQPATGQSASDQSATDRSSCDSMVTERRSIDQPATEQPATGQPPNEQPATGQPVGEQPATGQPVDERPSSDQPATDQSPAGGLPDKQDMTGRTPPDDQLPASYDRLIPIERLVHGEYNPRRVQPTAQLRRSIAADGIRTTLLESYLNVIETHTVQSLLLKGDCFQRLAAYTSLYDRQLAKV